jgi:4-carboxymuconolactone decarboxylase
VTISDIETWKPTGSRLPPLTKLDSAVYETLNKTVIRGVKPLNIFLTMAHHPILLDRFNSFGAALLRRGELAARIRELVIVRVAHQCRSRYEFVHHSRLALEAGVTKDELVRLTEDIHAHFGGDDAVVLDAVDEVCASNSLSDETWQQLAQRFRPAAIVELLLLIGFYRMTSAFLNGLQVQLESGV